MKPGDTLAYFSGGLLPYTGGKAIKFRLTATVGPEDYAQAKAVGWLGTLVSPEFEVVVPKPVRDDDLAHWRALLAEGRERGRLPEGGAVCWADSTGTGGHGEGTWRSFTVRGNTMEALGVWQAFPDDLLVLSADEVRGLCSFLLEGDRFAHAIDDFQDGKYGPSASLSLESATMRACWGGSIHKPSVREGWDKLIEALLAPRLNEARRRIAIPRQPPAGKQ